MMSSVSTYEHFAIAAVEGSVALVDGSLPSVEASWRLPDVLAAFEPLIGRPPYLRMAERIDEGDRELRLHVFDVGNAAAHDAELPAPLRPAFERWLAEQRGAPVPPLRAAWARPGWLAEAEAWAGCELEPHRMWPLSAVLRGMLDGETVFLKAVFPLFHPEPVITEALAREHPGAVPELLRADHERGWMLMPELRGEIAESASASLAPALREHARIQRSWSRRTADLLALGAQDRAQDWPDTGLPVSLAHGDFHHANVVVDDGHATIFDWSDACVAHPLIDLHTFLADCVEKNDAEVLVEAYADGWAVPASAVRSGVEQIATYACLHQAESYRAIAAGVEPAEREMFVDAEREWRERASAARAGTRPSPDTSP
jgi:Phosphotransferase enzyme family